MYHPFQLNRLISIQYFSCLIYPQLVELAVKQLDSKNNIVKPKDKVDTKNINPLTGSLITGMEFGR